MNYVRSFVIVAALLCAAGVSARPQAVVTTPSLIPPSRLLQTGMSLDQAAAMVQAKYRAQVMRANTVQEDGRIVHYIRLMSVDRSRVWTVRVDAATGQEF